MAECVNTQLAAGLRPRITTRSRARHSGADAIERAPRRTCLNWAASAGTNTRAGPPSKSTRSKASTAVMRTCRPWRLGTLSAAEVDAETAEQVVEMQQAGKKARRSAGSVKLSGRTASTTGPSSSGSSSAQVSSMSCRSGSPTVVSSGDSAGPGQYSCSRSGACRQPQAAVLNKSANKSAEHVFHLDRTPEREQLWWAVQIGGHLEAVVDQHPAHRPNQLVLDQRVAPLHPAERML